MKVYKCLVTGDELFTDTYPIETIGGLYKIKARLVTRSENLDDKMFGANPSAEEQDEGTETATKSGIDVVLDNRLQPTAFGSKKEFMLYFKDLVKRLEEAKKEKNPDLDTAKWRADIQAAFKTILAVPKFDEYEFFTGESQNPDGSIGLLLWETGETDDTPYVYFFVESVREEKC
jgi:hypothetical protein